MYPIYRKKKTTGKREGNLVAKLDKVFSQYIRLRDVMPNGCFRCISCGQIKPIEKGDCGHYYSRRHMSIRWDTDNAHLECTYCNRLSSEHLIGYRKNLVAKIGLDRIDRLNLLAHSEKHWLDSELKEKIEYFSSEVKRLSAEKGVSLKKT